MSRQIATQNPGVAQTAAKAVVHLTADDLADADGQTHVGDKSRHHHGVVPFSGEEYRQMGESRPQRAAQQEGCRKKQQDGFLSVSLSGMDGSCGSSFTLDEIGGQALVRRTGAQQHKSHGGNAQNKGTLAEKCGAQTEILDEPGDDGRSEDGGDTAACRADTQRKPSSGVKPVGDDQRQGDHAAHTVTDSRQRRRGAVHGETCGCPEAEAGQAHKSHSQGHDQTQPKPGAQLIDNKQCAEDEETARGGDPGALGVGKAVEGNDLRLIDGKDIYAQAHDRKQRQRAAQTDEPGIMRFAHKNAPFMNITIARGGRFVKKNLG